MSITRKEGPFVAKITGDLLSVHRGQTEGKQDVKSRQLTGSGMSTLFLCSLRQKPWFVVHSDGLYAQNAHDALTPLYRGEDASQLLCCITSLLTTVESKRLTNRWIHKFSFFASVFIVSVLVVIKTVILPALQTPSGSGLLTTVDTPRPGLSAPAQAAPVAPPVIQSYEESLRTVRPAPLQQPPVATNDNGWSLPQNVRAELPEKLHKAASRGLFTVPLSSGHARTIYVFADPACPNCQRMERHFETAAGAVNVVIFPVTIEGREASLNALTPVMALPEAERAAVWKQLFAADAGIGVPGAAQSAPAVTDETKAETARGAIGVNEVAFRAYRLPGTPWTIADDGRYVPQSVLSSPAALTAFLNGGDYVGQ